jgi:hypothetical protein
VQWYNCLPVVTLRVQLVADSLLLLLLLPLLLYLLNCLLLYYWNCCYYYCTATTTKQQLLLLLLLLLLHSYYYYTAATTTTQLLLLHSYYYTIETTATTTQLLQLWWTYSSRIFPLPRLVTLTTHAIHIENNCWSYYHDTTTITAHTMIVFCARLAACIPDCNFSQINCSCLYK